MQTYEPTNPAIVLASRHDYESFAAAELETRRSAGLPPTVRMARIICRENDSAESQAHARIRGFHRSLQLRDVAHGDSVRGFSGNLRDGRERQSERDGE